MTNQATKFVQFALNENVLKFGEYKTKSGRLSPYFFNAGLFNNGASVHQLGEYYAQTLIDSKIEFDMLFGPAYKGIPLATTTAIALAQKTGKDIPFAFNRKEAKDHGEGGVLVGAPLTGKVIIIDDVITAGTSVRESVALIRAAGATPAAVLIALDRMEKAGDHINLTAGSAVQEVTKEYGIPVISIANLEDIIGMLQGNQQLAEYTPAVTAYRDKYGI